MKTIIALISLAVFVAVLTLFILWKNRPEYTDSIICYDNTSIVFSENSVDVQSSTSGQYVIIYPDGTHKFVPVLACYVTEE